MLLDRIVIGTGPAVLLVHGTGLDAETTWRPLIDALKDRSTVVAPNLPGAGASAISKEPLTVEELATRIIATAFAAGVERFHVVGHSLGAVIATAVAAQARAEVASLFLHAGWLQTRPRERFMFDLWSRLLRADRGLIARQLVLTAMSTATLNGLGDAAFEQFTSDFTSKLVSGLEPQIDLDRRVDLRALVSSITAPTLVLASADDQILPPYHQRELADSISGARYEQVPGGHGLPLEDPNRFAELVVDFLGSVARY